MSKHVTFRLVLVSLMIVLPLLAACAAPPPAPAEPQVVEKVVTQIVEKQVEVEKPVVQTVQVEVEKEVEKIVTVEVPVEKETVTLAYNGYFEKTFGPAAPPIDAIREEVAKKYPNIEVQLNIMPYEAGPWRDNYLAWFQAEDGTTDLIGMGLYWLPEFAKTGWLMPLNDKIDPAILEKLNPAYLDAFTADGELLALGPWWGGIGGLYYRKDILEAAGIEPPETYAELVDAAKQVMADDPDMTGWTWGALKDQVLVNRWVEYLNGFGGANFDDAGKCVMNDANGLAALEFMKSLFDDGITPREALTWKEEESQVRFASGTALFHTGRQDMMFWLNDPNQSKVVDMWGFIPMPAVEAGQGAGFFEGWGFSINKFSDNPEAAAKVLEVMFDFPVQKAFNLSQGPVQAHMDVYSDPDVIKNNPNMPLIQKVADTAIPPIPSPDFADITSILSEELHSHLAGLKPAQEALDDACAQIDALNE
jgi:multiple sugar transport system substrate-binding protein